VRTFLTAQWRDLVLFSFEAPPVLFEPFVPRGVELDDWRGRTFFSLIGFRFLESRLLGVPIPFHGNFPEVNLRFYVRRQTPDGVRRGVVFLQELVPKQAVATLARRLYGENYVRVPMTQVVEPGRSAKYTWKTAGKQNWIAARTASPPAVPSPDSLETVTQGTFVRELLAHITKNQQRDFDAARKGKDFEEDTRPVLRRYFVTQEDGTILKIMLNLFDAQRDTWPDEWGAPGESILTKSTGFMATMWALDDLVRAGQRRKDLSKAWFVTVFQRAKEKLAQDQKALRAESFASSARGIRELQAVFKSAVPPDGRPTAEM
jgi:uncharacterized protein YqjF (DUF2071 family)